MPFIKKYTGKGKQVKDMDIVELTLKMSELEKHVFEYENERLVKIKVSKLKEADKFGRTHTSYVSVLVPEEQEA
tara:strand:+ start:1491 stop:1712 length:222 start_codon:yes stop_codon:yes gene_type:complete